jgi:uncharacterized membrane protein YphA (DoxX/SURF4 family)
MLGALFVYEGARALANPDPLLAPAKPLADRITPLLARTPLPADTKLLVQLNGATQLAGGLLMSSGRLARPTATVLAGSLAMTTAAAHMSWRKAEPAAKREQRLQLLKNLGVLGGLLLAAADTQGRPGLRWRTSHAWRSAKRGTRMARWVRAVGHRIPG